MGSLTSCIKKAGSALHADDKAAILAKARELKAAGASPQDAAMQAVQAQIAAVRYMLGAASPVEAATHADAGELPEAASVPVIKDSLKHDRSQLDAWQKANPEGPTPAGEAESPEPTPVAEQAKPKRATAAQRAYDALNAKRAAYFTPGNVVPSYGGNDEVLSYQPPDANGRWAVTVHAVRKVNGEWVRSGKPQDARVHSTQPDEKALAAGPVARLAHAPGSSVQYAEPRADARAFENAPDRGTATSQAEPLQEEVVADRASMSSKKIDDFGEKIGGARKDRWKERGLNLADLGDMSDAEAAELVTKANVWKPDWKAIVDAGMPAPIAAHAKIVYDRLAAQPKDNTPEGRRRYVTMMQAVRKVYSNLNAENVAGARNRLVYDELGWTSKDKPATAEHMAEAKKTLFSVYKGRSEPFGLDYNDMAKVKSMVKTGFPEKAEPWTRRYVVRERAGGGLTEAGVRAVLSGAAERGIAMTEAQARAGYFEVRNTKGSTLAYAPTKDAAEEFARQLYEQSLESDKAGEQPERPHLDQLTRRGLAQHADRDVTSEDFSRDFGFRGVEFGNWAAQDERQRILNMAYDGLHDLADLLHVPPKALSLNGTLGMAFGARGGGRFAAHYEPGKLVINMTKLQGGGSLAHEWAHALDHYFGELDRGDAYKTKARSASGWYEQRNYSGKPQRRMVQVDGKWVPRDELQLPNLRPELARAFDNVMQALYEGRIDKPAMLADLTQQLERTKRIAAAESDPELKAMYERSAVNQQQNIDEAKNDPEDTTYARGKSQYAAEAQKLSGKSSTGYWLRPTEMFARAFESYIFDRIAAQNAQSDYLVHGVEGERFADGERYKGNPYPSGKEREAINKAFDRLIGEIKTKESADGNVMLASRVTNDTAELRALKAISENDANFALPKSDKTSIQGIVAEVAPNVKVEAHLHEGLSHYVLTMRDGGKATIFVREPSPYGPHSYGSTFNEDNELTAAQTERPGDNPEFVPPETEDVYVNAANLKAAGDGAILYNIAATFAHNTGRIFIGDPAGLSDDAMIRRPEQMLSSALKFGTTAHIAPHPRQAQGDTALGVPPLKWVYGDDLGNIRRLIETNLAVQDAAGPAEITYDPSDGQFHDSAGQVIDRAGIGLLAEAAGGRLGARAGGRTLARGAVLRALLREGGGTVEGAVRERGGLLARLSRVHRAGAVDTGQLFYSRGAADQGSLTAEALRKAIEPIAAAWNNGPTGGVHIVKTADDMPPDMLRSMRSSDPDGVARAWFNPNTESVYLIADKLRSIDEAQAALFHEVYGHYGLRSVLGDRLGAELMQLRRANQQLAAEASMWFAAYGRDEVAARVARGMDRDAAERQVRLLSTEEALADRASSAEPLKGWDRFSAALQRGLRSIGLTGLADWLESRSQAETLSLLARARRAVQSGEARTPRADEGSLASRPLATALQGAFNNVQGVKLPAGYVVGDFLNESGKLSWWHKTVGTMHNLAERSPMFKRVYDGVQNFINDTSLYATEAADLAPRILPKLETWRDIAKSPLSAADTKAIGAPIFEGTLDWGRDEMGRPVRIDALRSRAESMTGDDKAKLLMRTGNLAPNVLRMWQGLPIDQFEAMIASKFEREALKAGVVWSDGELKSIFNLSDAQVPLYREFRKATDRSLANLATSEMLRVAGDDAAQLREKILSINDHDQAAVMLRDHLFKLSDSVPARKDALTETGNKMIEIADRATDLMKRGYAPLTRFGEYTLDVVVDGERKFFSLYETTHERGRAARQMRAEFPSAEIKMGTVSQEEYKLFAGVSPETVELFGEMLGLDKTGDAAADTAFQKYIQAARSNRSTLKRLLHRKGIAGFSEDAGRVLAGFVYSNARRTSGNLHLAAVDEAVNDIPQGAGELKDVAVRLADYVKNPTEEGQAIRGLLFTQYLGGSVAAAMVNMTQPVAVTFPYLSQYGGITKAAGRMREAARDALRQRTGDAALDAALHHAEEQGIVAPQEVHQLLAQSKGSATLKAGDGTKLGDLAAKGSNALSKLSLAWGKVFGVAEQFNRRITFIAAYRTAIAEGLGDPAKFAAKAVADTQFTYNKGNKPRWARGAIGGTLFTFKSYSVQYLELLHRMATQGGPEGKKAALLALAVLFLMSGSGGVPFAEDADDLIDGLMQQLGYNFSSKRAKKEFFASLLGEEGGRFIEHGLSGLPGVPIDVSGRMGMGNLIPGTGLLTKKNDHTSDVTEMLGPVGDLAKRTFQAGGQALAGDFAKAAGTLAPTAARNVIKAVDMADTGTYRDERGRKVIDVDAGDVVSKALGFQPNDVARVQEGARLAQDLVAQTRMRQTEVNAMMAQAIFEKDTDKRAQALAARDRWNEDNPDTKIHISMPSVIKQVAAMRESKAQRIERASPKGIRQQVRRELESAQ